MTSRAQCAASIVDTQIKRIQRIPGFRRTLMLLMTWSALDSHRDASAEQKQNALNCVNQAAAQPGHDEDFKRVGITTRRTVGAEKDKLLNDYIRVMKKYGL